MRCDKCDVWRIEDPRTATIICPMCGDSQPYQNTELLESEVLFSGHSSVQRNRFMYKRLTHFRIWLDRLQGRDSIPASVAHRIQTYLNCLPIKQVSDQRLRKILKELHLSEHVNSIPAILHKLYGVEPATLSPSEQLQAETLFHDIEYCFENNIKQNHPRKNMLSYSYMLQEILSILGVSDRFPHLKELKHEDKKREVQEVWEMIMEDLKIKCS